jgi:hypothetical protein
MVIFSHVFQKKYALSREAQMKTQETLQDLQERIQLAQGNMKLMQELQLEMMGLMQSMMKKQILPMCIRTVFFLGVLGLLRLFYGQYDKILPFPFLFGQGYFATYLFVSICASLIIAVFKKILKANKPVEDNEQVIDQVRVMKNNLTVSPRYMQQRANSISPSSSSPNPLGLLSDKSSYASYNPNAKTMKDWKVRLIEEKSPKKSLQLPESSESALNQNKSWKNKL